eukprot:TRINITY_DN3160_c2_g1_i4.p1 TRINITY_DN3160_c2_g1~~TRINITY_DN3160_c2_g1_i4.p1  ORF type:complete len:57 (-),score=3.09 TRINITY_DN3160_c2_g1_i4:48-218(-)
MRLCESSKTHNMPACFPTPDQPVSDINPTKFQPATRTLREKRKEYFPVQEKLSRHF